MFSLFSRTSIPAVVLCLAALAVVWPAADAAAVGFDNDDFLIAGFFSNDIGVYDSDFTFKGDLDASFNQVTGLDFNAAGNVVAAGQHQQVRAYNAAGTQLSSFTNNDLGAPAPIDLKVGPVSGGGNYYVGTQSNGLVEFTPAGITGRTFDTGDYEGVAVLPGYVLWGGGGGIAGIEVFDLITGSNTTTLPFDNGQTNVSSMFYSAATDTVLLTDRTSDAIYERQTDGTFLRSFTAIGLGNSFGVTRGPGGDVFATDVGAIGVYPWNAAGTFLGFTDLSASINGPINILYTGNIPEPATAGLLALGTLILGRRRAEVRVRFASLQ